MNPTEIGDRSFKERFLIIITVFVTLSAIGFAIKSCTDPDDGRRCGTSDEPRPSEYHQCIEGKWEERAPDRLTPFDGPQIAR